MHGIYTIVLFSFLMACQVRDTEPQSISIQEPKEIPIQEYDWNQVYFDNQTSLWYLKSDSALLSGWIVKKQSNDSIELKFCLFKGEKDGILEAFYLNGQLKYLEHYRNNKLHGEVKRWTLENGYQLQAQLKYQDGKLHGEQKKWFPTGELHKLMHMKEGKEDGLQQAFRKNGVLYANYEARNGRTFGMKRSNLCYELDNEQVVYRD